MDLDDASLNESAQCWPDHLGTFTHDADTFLRNVAHLSPNQIVVLLPKPSLEDLMPSSIEKLKNVFGNKLALSGDIAPKEVLKLILEKMDKTISEHEVKIIQGYMNLMDRIEKFEKKLGRVKDLLQVKDGLNSEDSNFWHDHTGVCEIVYAVNIIGQSTELTTEQNIKNNNESLSGKDVKSPFSIFLPAGAILAFGQKVWHRSPLLQKNSKVTDRVTSLMTYEKKKGV